MTVLVSGGNGGVPAFAGMTSKKNTPEGVFKDTSFCIKVNFINRYYSACWIGTQVKAPSVELLVNTHGAAAVQELGIDGITLPLVAAWIAL